MSARVQRTVRPGWVTFVAGMASFLDAGAIVTTGTALVLYQDRLGLDGAAIAQMSALLTITIAIGALVGGRLGDSFGRRRVFTVTMIVYAIGAAIATVGLSAAWLYVGLALLGLATGADLPVSLAMIGESAKRGARGRAVSSTHFLWIGGILVPTALGIFVGGMGATGAHVMYGVLLVIALVVLVLRAGIPESEAWTEAKTAATQTIDTRHAQDAASAAEIGEQQVVSVNVLRQLLRTRYVIPLVAIALFYAIGNITGNTLGQFSTYLYVNVAHSTVSTASVISLCSYAFNLLAMVFVVKFMDTRWRMLVFGIGAAVAAAAYATPALLGVNIGTMIAVSFLSALGGPMAGEPIFKVWSQELFPTLYRSTAQGIAIAFTRAVAAAVALVTPALAAVGARSLFVILFASVVVAALIGLLWVARLRKADDDAPRPSRVEPSTVL
ncbi:MULTISPECIES: MFS transporter [Curtobacterium]|uniref:MFS transporter n=1 Tax=Curtobacterium flaccumfaciens TaxID=2035 RepID=UPI003EE67D27